MFPHCKMPRLYHKPKCMTAEERKIRPTKRYPCRSKKKLPKKLLIRQAKQEKENKSHDDRLTLIERFNMFEITDDLKRRCPSVNREYSTYQPMTDIIYTKWERTRSLSVAELQQNLPLLDIDGNQSKSKVGKRAVSSAGSYPADIDKMPISSTYSVSPLLLRKDIAAIVTDNIPTESDSTTPTKNADKGSVSTTATISSIHKDLMSRRKQPVRKEVTTEMVRKWEISASRRHLHHPVLAVEEVNQSPISFGSYKVSTPGTGTTKLGANKKNAWDKNETDGKNRKYAPELVMKNVNFSIFHPNFGPDSKNESVSKSIFWNIIPDDMEALGFRIKDFIDVHGNSIPRINLWDCI